MALPALASLSQLIDRMGRDFTGNDAATQRALVLLTGASAAVRGYTGQEFTRGVTTNRVKPRRGAVYLTQRPVHSVSAVTQPDGTPVEFTWDGLNLTVADVGFISWLNRDVPPVDVTYDHGWDETPADITAVVCQVAGRAFGRSLDDSGVQSESLGGYSYSVGVAVAAGGLGLLNDERRVLDRYRRNVGVAGMA